jgi:hypothetical protein
MQQHRLTLVPPMFGLVLVAASTSNVNAVSCIAKPNGQAPQGQHWFYRTDRVTHRQCWYLAAQNGDAQKSATKPLSSTRKLPAAPRHAHRPTAAAPRVAHAASAAETDVPPPAAAALAEAAKLPDAPPSFAPAPQSTLAQSSRLADATGPAPAPATNNTEEPQSPVNAQTSQVATAAQAAVEAPSSLIVVTLALLTMVGPVFHAARWLRRRKASDRRGFGQAGPLTVLARTCPDSDSETAAQYIPPPQLLKQAEKEVALALQQLLNDTQTKSHVESLDQKEQLAQELQQLLNEAQTKQGAKARGQTEQLAEALNILHDRASQRVERHHGPLASEEEPLRSRDLLLANQRN